MLDAGGKLEEEIWDEFVNNKEKLHQVAQNIIFSVQNKKDLISNSVDREEEEDEFPEGKVLYRVHKLRERNNDVIKKKKKQAADKNQLKCEVCGFDFYEKYGDLGKGYIECHHIVPVSEYSEETKTKMRDLVLLCSNCHRMIHRRRPWINKDNLKQLIKK